MAQKYIQKNGLIVNCDGTTIKDRKPEIQLKPNHFHKPKGFIRIWDSKNMGTAIRDGNGWYKPSC